MSPSINLRTYPPSSSFQRLRLPQRSIKRTSALTLTAVVLLILYLTILFHAPSRNSLSILHTTNITTTRTQSSIRIAKATILYSPSNSIYTHNLRLHAQQGYETHILRSPIVKGFSNTFLWLQHIITSELLKDEPDRAEWILFFAPDVVSVHPNIPLHTFLPPRGFDRVHVVGTKRDGRDMDSSLFFVRVGPLSLRLLALGVASVYLEPARDWGGDIVGAALRRVLERDEYRDKAVWQPWEWYDGDGAAFARVWGFSGVEKLREVGRMISVQSGSRNSVEARPSEDEVGVFWDAIKNATLVLSEARHRGHTSEEGEFAVWVRGLKEWVELKTWDSEGIRERMEILKSHMGIGDVIGYEMNFG